MDELTLVEWLNKRADNCLRIANEKSGQDRLGWLEDERYFREAIREVGKLGTREWVKCTDRLPELTREQAKRDGFGVQVLIWPPFESEGASAMPVAFYGRRHSDTRHFYIYGRVIDAVTHWMPLPEAPP